MKDLLAPGGGGGRLPALSRLATGFVIAMGCIILAGWALSVQRLILLFPTVVAMNPVTALIFILAGIALWRVGKQLAEPRESANFKRPDRLTFALALIVTLVAALKLANCLLGLPFPVDYMLFPAKVAAPGSPLNEMAPNTAFLFFLCGLALLLFDKETKRGIRPAQPLILVTALIALVAFLGYAYRMLVFSRVGHALPMSLDSAIAFLAFSVGFLAARPESGFMKVITSHTPGGSIARRLLPTAVLVPCILGAMLLACEQANYFGRELGVSIFAVSSIVIFTGLIWWNAKLLYVAELERGRTERRLAVQHTTTQILAQAKNLDDAMPRILRTICETMGWPLGAMWTNGQKDKMLHCTKEWHVHTAALDHFVEECRKLGLPGESGLPGQVWQTGTPAWRTDGLPENEAGRLSGISNSSSSVPAVLRLTVRHPMCSIQHAASGSSSAGAGAAGLHGELAFPIHLGNEKFGVLEFFTYEAQRPDEPLVEVLTSVGSQIGQFVERTRAEAQLRQTSTELERSNTDLQQFAYVASHDLFEPLRMVTSYLQLLTDRSRDRLDKQSQDFIGFAMDGARRMQALIKDLLAYARVDTRGNPFERTDLEEVFQAAISNLKIAIEETKAVIAHEPLPTLIADRVQMTQVIQNLIGNAIKFHGSEPPRIEIGARREKEEWIFSVHDNGIGIDPKNFERIFAIFQRLHTRREYPGTGIGLSICKKIVERHGGRIWLESAPGKGSTFFFTLPAEPENAAPALERGETQFSVGADVRRL